MFGVLMDCKCSFNVIWRWSSESIFLTVDGAAWDGSCCFEFDRRQREFEAYCPMITINSIHNRYTVMDSFMKWLWAGKNIMHTWYTLGVSGIWDAGVGDIYFWLVLKECVLYAKVVGCKALEKVFTRRITSRDTMWTNNIFLGKVGAYSYAGVYVRTYHYCCVWFDGIQFWVNHFTEFFMDCIITGKVSGYKSNRKGFLLDFLPTSVVRVEFHIYLDESSNKIAIRVSGDWWVWSCFLPRFIKKRERMIATLPLCALWQKMW